MRSGWNGDKENVSVSGPQPDAFTSSG